MSSQIDRIRRYAIILCTFWTLIVMASFGWFYFQQRANIIEIAKAEARIAFQKDTLYRKWASSHGGVYVPATPASPPNPNLSHIPERDISSPSGKRLTLINPAYMTRQVFELATQDKDLVRGHITSLKPIRPENTPDPWETKALLTFEKGNTEFSELQILDGQPYMRFMRPFVTEKPCLKCHAAQGYVEGDVRGGVSVSVPMSVFSSFSNRLIAGTATAHTVIWLLGIGTIGIGSRKLQRNTTELEGKNRQLEREVRERQAAQESLQTQAAVLELEVATRREREAELEGKNAELERFTYTVSHDLKSPLITIKGFAGALLKDIRKDRHDRLERDLQRITEAADKMGALLNDLLELSRIGRMMNPPTACEMGEIVHEALQALEETVRKNQVALVVQPDLPTVQADRMRMVEVFQNLIENALKYRGAQTALRIEIGVRQTDQRKVFYVMDNGMGIERSYQETVFGLFNKLDTHSEGTGIGLALARRIIEFHGGTIWVESDGAGRGSTFCFTINEQLPTAPLPT